MTLVSYKAWTRDPELLADLGPEPGWEDGMIARWHVSDGLPCTVKDLLIVVNVIGSKVRLELDFGSRKAMFWGGSAEAEKWLKGQAQSE